MALFMDGRYYLSWAVLNCLILVVGCLTIVNVCLCRSGVCLGCFVFGLGGFCVGCGWVVIVLAGGCVWSGGE